MSAWDHLIVEFDLAEYFVVLVESVEVVEVDLFDPVVVVAGVVARLHHQDWPML